MRTAKTAFNDTLLKKYAADPEKRGNDYTDAGCRNLVIYIARDGVVTFTFRKRVKGAPSGRVFESLGTWSKAFTLTQAKDACAVRRTELSQKGYVRKTEAVTVLESIPKYEAARQRRDPLASRKRAKLGKDWAEHIDRFREVFADLLPLDVNKLQRADFTDCMEKYGERREKETGVEWDERRLGPMMSYIMPMLGWYTRQYRLDPREIYGLQPPGYGQDGRYLLPGEWQASAPHVDALEHDLGLYWRFMLYTCTRTTQAAGMQWDEINWGNWRIWKDDKGIEHKALIWIPPRERAKARDQEGGEKLPRRVLITGESLVILERLRAIWEKNRENPEHAHWNGVFPERALSRYNSARSALQRQIEEKAGTQPWDRMTLRHTHTTYLGFLGCPASLMSLSMNHAARASVFAAEQAAPITDRYNNSDTSTHFRPNDPLLQLAPWHLRLHKLIRDIERGVKSADLAAMQVDMRDGQNCRDMCKDNDINRAFIDVKPAKLTIVA